MSNTGNSSPILMKLALLPYIFEKYSNIKFSKNPFSGSLVIPCEGQEGKENGQTDNNSRFSQFARP